MTLNYAEQERLMKTKVTLDHPERNQQNNFTIYRMSRKALDYFNTPTSLSSRT